MTEYTPDALFRTYITRLQSSPRALTTISRTSKTMFHAGIRALLELQTKEWDKLSVDDAIRELRNPESLFLPRFIDDHAIWADCPECGRVFVDKEGYCYQCGYEFI